MCNVEPHDAIPSTYPSSRCDDPPRIILSVCGIRAGGTAIRVYLGSDTVCFSFV